MPSFTWGYQPPGVAMKDIYKGIIPFVILQLIAIYLVFQWPLWPLGYRRMFTVNTV